MQHEIDWWFEGRIIRITATGSLEIQHLAHLDTIATQMVAAGTAPVHVVVNVNGVTSYPPSLESFLHIVRPSPHPEQLGWTVIVEGHDAALRFIMSILAQFLGVRGRVHSTNTLEEALVFLRSQDATLSILDAHADRAESG